MRASRGKKHCQHYFLVVFIHLNREQWFTTWTKILLTFPINDIIVNQLWLLVIEMQVVILIDKSF